jgi:hypothetical protein
LEKIRRTNGPNPSSLPVDDKKRAYVTSSFWASVVRIIRGPTCGVTIVTREIAKFKQQKKAHFEAKAGPVKKSLTFFCLFEEIIALKRQLKPEKIASSKKRNKEGWIHPLFSLLKQLNH